MFSTSNVFFLLILHPGDPDKQAEAAKAHQKLSEKAGGSNDFATLLAIYQKCSERYVNFRCSDICSGDSCTGDDISDNRVRVRVMIWFLVRGKVRIMIKFRVRVGVTSNVSIYHRSNCRRSKCRTFKFQSMFSDLEICIMLCKSK